MRLYTVQIAPILEDFFVAGAGRFKAKLKNLYIYFWRWATWKVWESSGCARSGPWATSSPARRGPRRLDGPSRTWRTHGWWSVESWDPVQPVRLDGFRISGDRIG